MYHEVKPEIGSRMDFKRKMGDQEVLCAEGIVSNDWA
jgi:hypothetical protein